MVLSMVFLFGCGGGEGSGNPGGDRESGAAAGEMQLEVSPDSIGTTALLQAVSPVDRSVVWVSGHAGTYARSTDGGEHWQVSVMQGAGDLQFRDVEAFDSLSAVLMSAGPGGLSRIYRTSDGGRSWDLQYRAQDPGAFLDCLAFWDSDHGLAYGDSVDEFPFILRTMDGGERWARVPPSGLPQALEGEGGFAASGTCLVTGEGGRAWVATGAGLRPRVLMTEDWGESWRAVEVPVVGGGSSGLTTLQVGPDGWGIALGGTIGEDTLRTQNVAVTEDGGRSWQEANAPAMTGPIYGSALVDLGRGYGVVAVGPMGLDWAVRPGLQWREADSLSYWAVAFADSTAGWAVGPEGRLARLAFREAR